MVDKILLQDQGITYGLFTEGDGGDEPEDDEKKEDDDKSQYDDDGNPIPKPEKEKKEKFLKHTLINEVVEEGKMHFYQVPKLGSYLAIKMEYNSCLTEEAFDAAVADFKEVNVKKIAQ